MLQIALISFTALICICLTACALIESPFRDFNHEIDDLKVETL